jgi:hypothetical protein
MLWTWTQNNLKKGIYIAAGSRYDLTTVNVRPELAEEKIVVAAVTVRQDGFAEMAYVGKKPWHGLGQELVAGADIETWKQAAG